MTNSAHRPPAFGVALADYMAIATWKDGEWSAFQIAPCAPLQIHPAAHVLHYSSTCFDACKAYRWADGSVNLFRVDCHIERLRQSARALELPQPGSEQLVEMIRALIEQCRGQIPVAPGALYLRPVLFGTTANIGAAATPPDEVTLVVLASPVADYFAGGMRPLRIYVDDVNARATAHFGMIKTGGNYAAAMGPTRLARRKYGADQVLFCPGGEVQESGATNFLLLREGHLLTRSLDSSFLHGVTRDSILTLVREKGYRVEERLFNIAEMLEWVRAGEAALSGTAVVLAGVGELIYNEQCYSVGTAGVGSVTRALRAQLTSIQFGESPAPAGWMTRV